MRRNILFVAVLVCASGAAAAVDLQKPVEIDLGLDAWAAQPQAVAAARRAAAFSAARDDGLRFSIRGNLGEQRAMRWAMPWRADFSSCRFLVMEYKARWLLRRADTQDVLAAIAEAPGRKRQAVPLVLASEVIDDGLWHRLIVNRPLPNHVRELAVTLETNCSRAELAFRRVYCTSSDADLGPALGSEDDGGAPATVAGAIVPVDLSSRFDARWDELVRRMLDRPDDPVAQDAGCYPAAEHVTVDGVPFLVRPEGRNLVAPPPKGTANDEWIENFGLRVKRGRVAPVSRDDVTEIPIGQPAREVFLLLATEMPSKQKAYFVRERPKALTDVESFVVELRYADGAIDFAFPYSMTDRAHVIQRALAAYAVPGSGGMLKSVVLHNRSLLADVYLAGLSVNTGTERRCPQLVEPAPMATPAPRQIVNRPPLATRDGNTITLGNSCVELTADLAKGFAIRGLVNRWLGEQAIALAGEPSLQISVAGHELAPEQMRVTGVKSVAGGFEVSYCSDDERVPLDWTIRATIGAEPEVRLGLTLTNRGAAELTANVRFPVVANLQLGAAEDLWYMFPQYCNALDRRPQSLYAQAGRIFPMQFMDLFNPRLGGGVWLVTEDVSHKAQRYGLRKDGQGASMFVEYPSTFTHLEPNRAYECCPTVLGVHTGDWHAAAERYRQWVATWYKPVKSQDKQWYRECFWLLAEIADGLDADTYRLPAWYDAATGKHKMRDIVAEWERVAGRRPDILHFWSWTYSEADKEQRWGEYGGADYAALGGLPAWHAALDDVQREMKIPVSLYVNATLCNRATPAGQTLGPDCAMRLPDGRPMIPYPNSYRMCHATPQWIAYMKELYPRLAKETGAPILYVDETASSAVCCAKDHGHAVPSNPNEADYHFLKAIREVTNGEVAMYGEYPNVDVASQYSDCNINYYFMTAGQQLFCPAYDGQADAGGPALSPLPLNVYRYLFPRIVQLDLPLGMRHGSWHELKFTFFHGEAVYDSFWDRDETKGHAFMVRAYDLKKQYKDCFTGDDPQMLVPTAMAGVCANRFPGKGRTLWTIYNRRYTGVRGTALPVQHVEGATYRDAWNDRPLKADVRGTTATLSLELGPQEIGCVVQER